MTRLTVVARDVTPKAETVAERVRRLQNEARQAARDHVKAFAAAMVDLEQFAAEIADGGEAYPAGVRDLARRLAEDLETRVQSVEAISARAER
jgi:ABC-type transporter Mla subunit MlaD